jgi:ABC-type amino acid transport substrate-binding protein
VGTRTLERAVAKLKAGHCDVLLTDEEVVRGARMTFGKDLFPPDQFAFAHPAYVKLNPLHMMVGRALPYRDALVDFMTKAIAQMEKSGEGAKLIQRYIGPS